MKRVIIILTVILAFPIVMYGQGNETLLYNDKGQLRADTTLTISPEQLNRWSGIEQLLIAWLVDEVEYSQMATESELTGTSIVSFDIDSLGKFADYQVIKQVGGGLEAVAKQHLKGFRMLSHLALNSTNNKYFIAFSFQIVDADEFIKKEKAIPIFKVVKKAIQKD